MNPFYIEGPAAISFSGGRTSGLMLHRILDAHDGVFPEDVHVLFANTGKEREETLTFVRECGERWGVKITWLEYRRHWEPSRTTGAYRRHAVAAEVTYETASRRGEPFLDVIEAKRYLPNPVTRFCTVDLKIRTMHRWLRACGYTSWTQAVGLRADERDRVASILSGCETPAEEVVCPLASAGITKVDVMAFWASQPFDLQLRPWEGNCDLCFLKGEDKRVRVMRDRPDLAEWWIERERERGAMFRAHGADYATLLRRTRQPFLPLFRGEDPSDLGDCRCTD